MNRVGLSTADNSIPSPSVPKSSAEYVCMYEICFYSCLLSYYMLINVDYTITYFLPIPSTVPRTRARSELLNVSLVPPRVEFYTALPVSIVGRY